MPILGPYTGDKDKPYSYLSGAHWKGMKGYRVCQGNGEHRHLFGGQTWKVPICEKCNEPMHQIFTFDLKDTKLIELRTENLNEIPLVSCLNCSTYWEPQVYKLDFQNKEVKMLVQNDTQDWVQDEEDRIPSSLPSVGVVLNEMKEDDIPGDRNYYDRAFDMIGSEYICRILGAPLYAQNPLDRECPICKKEMFYIATIAGENYGQSGNLISGVDFVLGEVFLYFLFCKDCLIVKTESQGT